MNIHVISVGKLDKNFQVIAGHYSKMIKWPVKFTEIIHNKKFLPEQLKAFESKLISELFTTQSFKIALEVTGQNINSHQFAKMVDQALCNYKALDFIIGGAFGLDAILSASANARISLSPMTMPHMLAKIVLIEQLYRTQTILQNHPYHK